MDEDRVSKFRYNINIQYTRGGPDHKLTSAAVFSECLARPLLKNPSQWDVTINKFKIDTFSIPLTIVELQDYQPLTPDGTYLTDYWVYLEYNGITYFAQCVHNPERKVHASPRVMHVKEEDGTVKYDNTDPTFFVYSYQHFLDMINGAITDVCHQAGLDAHVPEITFDPDTQRINVAYTELFRQDISNPAILSFGKNLEKYVGKGFRCTWTYDDNYGYMFNHYIRGNVTYIQQEYSTVTSWNICNAILITSSSLPVQPEYYPIHSADGDLVHDHPGASEYTNMSNLSVLSVYYPNATKAGDMSTSVYYSTDNIANGDRISLRGTTPINRMDVQIYWADVYNNLYQLHLPENGQASIRLVFIKK